VSEIVKTIFQCDGCPAEYTGEKYALVPQDWRRLEWSGGYVGDEKRDVHYCSICAPERLELLDIVLQGKGKSVAR
jgi:hypothetical protein